MDHVLIFGLFSYFEVNFCDEINFLLSFLFLIVAILASQIHNCVFLRLKLKIEL